MTLARPMRGSLSSAWHAVALLTVDVYVTVEGFVAIGYVVGIECILGGFVG